MVSIIIIILLLVYILCLIIRQKKMSDDVSLLVKTVQKVRYGDINIRLQNMNNKNLETTLNRLLETIYDREMMIREYQATLSDKNLSLEEIIKQQKEIQMLKEEFAATLTHDMKVPVIAELNSIEYLLESRFGSVNEKQAEVLKLMQSSITELKNLIENMLETYKLDQKTLKISPQLHNFNEFLIPIIKEMYPIAVNTQHNIIYKIDKTIGLNVVFDEFQIKRIIKNLIQNAVSFSPNTSDINIETESEKRNIKFIITNIGNNISKEDLEMIFQKYYSGHSKFRKAGTGLGLYISQQIALAHNGEISVDCSKEGHTSFILTLPLDIVG